MALLGGVKKGRLFVVSAPAGTGKTTLIKMLTDEFHPYIRASVSSTTRKARPYETQGKDYEFISKAEFETQIKEGAFLEYAEVFGDYYGTRKEQVESLQKNHIHVVLVIDTQGALQIRKLTPATLIFISPPSMQELSRRLGERNTENEKEIHERLVWARRELEMIKDYDYNVVNDNLEEAYHVLRSIFIAETHRVDSLYIDKEKICIQETI